MEKRTQINDISTYLKRHKRKGITSLEAIDLFGCTRLSACIHVLRYKRGMNIVTIKEDVPTRYGSVKVARYVLED